MRVSTSIFIAATVLTLTHAHAGAPVPFSQYGVIQNVQNYSTNPYWDPNGPYNQRLPQPVYVQGVQIETAECQQVVAGLVATQCAMRNNCRDARLSDIRPGVMLQLSQIPSGNYATACVGYIDSAFDNYVKQYGYAMPTGVEQFPNAIVDEPAPQIEIQNPYKKSAPDWATEMQERKQELLDLQAQNGANQLELTKTEFPTVYADLSFQDRMNNLATGYEPYKDKSAYVPIKVEDRKLYLARKKEIEQLEQQRACINKKAEFDKMVVALNAIHRCRANKTPISQCSGIGDYL
ncbi:MAG: hypothetical protein R8M37_02440 [Alphaproteobacteria bacterium]|nr:hypothetical protein [Alphaproteobacteria bacterium]